MKKDKVHAAKNSQDLSIYRKQIRNAPCPLVSSSYSSYPGFIASNDDYHKYDEPKQEKVGPLSPRAWLNKNWKGLLRGVLEGLLLGVICFAAKWVLDQNATITLLNYRIQEVEERILTIEDASVTKDFLDLKLQLVKSEMATLLPNTQQLESDVTDLEQRVSTMEVNQSIEAFGEQKEP